MAMETEQDKIRVGKGPGLPEGFDKKIEAKLRDRSGGRFFGKKTLTERIPFIGIALVLLCIAGLIYWQQRASTTGTLTPVKGPLEPPVENPGGF